MTLVPVLKYALGEFLSPSCWGKSPNLGPQMKQSPQKSRTPCLVKILQHGFEKKFSKICVGSTPPPHYFNSNIPSPFHSIPFHSTKAIPSDQKNCNPNGPRVLESRYHVSQCLLLSHAEAFCECQKSFLSLSFEIGRCKFNSIIYSSSLFLYCFFLVVQPSLNFNSTLIK